MTALVLEKPFYTCESPTDDTEYREQFIPRFTGLFQYIKNEGKKVSVSEELYVELFNISPWNKQVNPTLRRWASTEVFEIVTPNRIGCLINPDISPNSSGDPKWQHLIHHFVDQNISCTIIVCKKTTTETEVLCDCHPPVTYKIIDPAEFSQTTTPNSPTTIDLKTATSADLNIFFQEQRLETPIETTTQFIDCIHEAAIRGNEKTLLDHLIEALRKSPDHTLTIGREHELLNGKKFIPSHDETIYQVRITTNLRDGKPWCLFYTIKGNIKQLMGIGHRNL